MDVEVEWPSYADLVIEASNVTHSMAKPDTHVQLMFKIRNLAKDYEDKGLTPDYGVIEKKILRAKPHYADDVPQLIQFVQHWSGGADNPVFLLAVQEYVRTLDCVHPISNLVLKPLNEADLGFKKGARFRNSGVKAISKYFISTQSNSTLCNTYLTDVLM